MDAGLDQEALAHSCLNKTNEKKNNRNDRGSRARRRTNAMPGIGRRYCNIPSCSPRALHRGPLVADVQAEYADLATAPTETKVVELDAGQVRELDRGGDYRRPDLVTVRSVSSCDGRISRRSGGRLRRGRSQFCAASNNYKTELAPYWAIWTHFNLFYKI
jgi:hypothetical protein